MERLPENDHALETDPRAYDKKPEDKRKVVVKKSSEDVYFIIPRIVKILYGPYMQEGIMDYRQTRLQGLKTFLEKLGVTVELKPSPDHVNLVRVWFLEELIFSCKLTQLIYGGDGELDPICWDAANALERFIKKVLKGLRRSKPIEPASLKRPFCPCFHVGEEGYQTQIPINLKGHAPISPEKKGTDSESKSKSSSGN